MENFTFTYLNKVEKSICKNELTFNTIEPVSISTVSLPKVELVTKLKLSKALKLRSSSRKIEKNRPIFKKQHLVTIINLTLKARKIRGSGFHYPTPVAGGLRELRYILVIREVLGIPSGIWEYVPESNELKMINDDSISYNEIFYDKWEKQAYFNLLTCLNVKKPKRLYVNNLLHCAFESGAISQSIQLLTSELKFKSCISGHIHKKAFDTAIGTKLLYPIYGLSIF